MGIAGLGGLGQMGVLLAKAMGNHVTVISSSSRKIAMAKELGSDFVFQIFSQCSQIFSHDNTEAKIKSAKS